MSIVYQRVQELSDNIFQLGMATSLQMSQTGSHLLINTYGPARLYYHGKGVADSEEITKYPIGTLDFKFLIRVNTNGGFDIQQKDGINYNITIEMNERICQMQIQGDELTVPPFCALSGDKLTQNFSLGQIEYKESHFRVLLLNSRVFRRVDSRFLRGSWATMTMYNNQLVNVCLQGYRQLSLRNAAFDEICNSAIARNEAAGGCPIQSGSTSENPRRPRSNSMASNSTVASTDEKGNERNRASTGPNTSR